MKEVAKNIARQEFQTQSILIQEIVGKGKNNFVFKIVANDTSYILRLRNSQKELKTYQKEEWCSEVARKAGIPTPEILKVGTYETYAFSIQDFVDGTQGAEAKDDVSKIWHTLGQYAKIINSIPAPEITFNYSTFVQELFAEDFFTADNIFSQELSAKIQDRLEETTGWDFLPNLCHGNLHPSNVILSEDGVVHLIDWETATGNRVPQSELAEIYTWNTGKENVSQFLDGYGLTENEVQDMMRDIQTLVLLRLVSVIRKKIGGDDDWKQNVYIQNTVARLEKIENYQNDILFTKNL